MKLRHWAVVAAIIFVVVLLGGALSLSVTNPVLMQPSGLVGVAQRDLFIFALVIMSLVALPVFALLGYISWKYRASNKKAAYAPNWDSSPRLEALWWGIPILVVIVLSVAAYQSSHKLDPFRSIETNAKTLNVQVVALQWKWLFIYPDYNVASVDELIIPIDRPVAFSITSDAPMNSFWIPELGGQIYAMSGMSTKLSLQANRAGQFRGMSSNISGAGFADMTFRVNAVNDVALESIMKLHAHDQPLDMSQYAALAEPSISTEPQWFMLADSELYDKVIAKYMLPGDHGSSYDGTMNEHSNHGATH